MEAGGTLEQRARAALERGDMFAAYDLASSGDPGEDAGSLAYVRVLALARLGDWRSALAAYDAAAIGRRGDVDSLSLRARLLKDRAFAAPAAERIALLAEARDAYRAALEATGEAYAAINAATLSALMGDGEGAHALARPLAAPAQASGGYWPLATRAEALAVLGRLEEARVVLAEAARQPDAGPAARATTFAQLQRLLAATAVPPAVADALLDPVRPARVAHLCGALLAAGDPREPALAEAIRDALRAERVGMAFGALACGADIIAAEQALALGIELHVVFPFDRADFVRHSVAIGGAAWLARYERCLAAAAGVYQASAMRYVGDDAQFAFGSRTTMGMALLRAHRTHAEAVQIAVTDDQAPTGLAGTAADVAQWRAAGGRSCILPTLGVARARLAPLPATGPGAPDPAPRALRVLVFADFKGFSRLAEGTIPRFWREIMAACAEALAPHRAHILASNTWGDGLHLVFAGVEAAAPALADLAERLAACDLAAFGAESEGGMRIAAHFGSVYAMTDPVTGRANFYGGEVSRAARLEPVTPPGQVYVTEPFAAALAMAPDAGFESRYVGRLTLPKGFGTEPIYALERRPGP